MMTSKDLTGRSIKGYTCIEKIGGGAHDTVYRARQTLLNREVAIRFFLPELANQSLFVRSFQTSTQRIAEIDHIHIVPILDYWREPSGAYVVMRWMRGGNLHDRLRGEAFEKDTAALILDQLASGLAAAHRNGVYHTTLTPSNVLFDDEQNAYLSGFEHPGGWSPSNDGEQPAERDIYQLGLILYSLLVGTTPLQTDLGFVSNILESDAIISVISKATHADPHQRYTHPLQLSVAFRQAVGINQLEPPLNIIDTLTPRELEIWQLIVHGDSNSEIAQELVVELSTVKWHITQLYRKLDVRTRVQAMRLAGEIPGFSSIGPGNRFTNNALSTSLNAAEIRNPFKGLSHFHASDSQYFFGRSNMIESILARLENPRGASRAVFVIGPSGSGKSSLLQAGLIPALREGAISGSESWYSILLTPGNSPLEELEHAIQQISTVDAETLRETLQLKNDGLWRCADMILPDHCSRLVIFLDQFEQLFTLTHDETQRKTFLDLLCSAAEHKDGRVCLILALRSDYFDRLLQYPKLAHFTRDALEPIRPMSTDQLRQVITCPLRVAGVQLEPDLENRLISEVQNQPGALPFLQYALMELFDRREHRLLTNHAYEAIGGITGALAQRAEELFQEMPKPDRELTRKIFLRLVTISKDPKSIDSAVPRRRVPLIELGEISEDKEQVEEIIDAFVAYRLLSLDHDPVSRIPTVAIAHEALIDGWGRLSSWLDDHRQDLLLHNRLQLLIEDWEMANQNQDFLLVAPRLDQYIQWVEEGSFPLSLVEKVFLDLSRSAQVARQAEEDQRDRAASLTIRRTRRLAWGLLGAILTIALLVIGTLSSSRDNRRQQILTESLQLATSAQGQLTRDPQLSLLLALEAVSRPFDAELNVPREALESLHAAIQASRLYASIQPEKPLASAVYLPDGEHMLFIYQDHTVGLWDLLQNEESRVYSGHQGSVMDAVPFQNGEWFITTGRDEAVRIWDRDDSDFQSQLTGVGQVFDAAVNHTGTRFAFASSRGYASVYQLNTRRHLFDLLGHKDYVTAIEFSPEDNEIATTSYDKTIKLWDPADGSELITIDAPEVSLQTLKYSPDGLWLAAGDVEGNILIWDRSDMRIKHLLDAHSGIVMGIEFNPDGTLLASFGEDDAIKLWDPHQGELLFTLPASDADITRVSFHPSVPVIAVSSIDGFIRFWNLAPGAELLTISLAQTVSAMQFDPSGNTILTSDATTASVWDISSGSLLMEFPSPVDEPISDVTASFDGKMIALGGVDGSISVFSMSNGELQQSPPGHNEKINQLAFNPAANLLASAGDDRSALLWDIQTGALIRRVLIGSAARSITFHPNGSTLAVGSATGLVRIFDTETGDILQLLSKHTQSIDAIRFNPDGSVLATASRDRSVRLWDVERGLQVLVISSLGLPVSDLSFSPDGKRLATIEANGVIRIWDAANGAELLALPTASFLAATDFGIAFSPDGTRLASVGGGALRILTLLTEELLTLGRSRVTRDFTFEECRFFLPHTGCLREDTSSLTIAPGQSQVVSVCQITSVMGVSDEINQIINQGAQEIANQYEWDLRVIEANAYIDLREFLDQALEADCDFVITIYNDMGALALEYAFQNPEIRFLMLDLEEQEPLGNAWRQTYSTDQASFLAGYLAAAVSKTGKIGTFGGIPFASVTSFMSGYEQGARYYNLVHGTKVEVLGWDSSTSEGYFIGEFCCMNEGRQLFEELVSAGADVIFPVAGSAAGRGAALAAQETDGVYVIGVDFDWAVYQPDLADVILTSVLKHYDTTLKKAAEAVQSGTFVGGSFVGDMTTDEVGLAPIRVSTDVVTKAIREELENIHRQILFGAFSVDIP